MKEKLIRQLEAFVTDRRLALINKVMAQRTRYITVVLEDIFQPQNASAVLRSCDCFGIQDVHIIENKNAYQINPDVALGSQKWLSLYKYRDTANNTAIAIDQLKQKGYRIVATTPHKQECRLDDFNVVRGKFALVFGTELEGLSAEAISRADEYLTIPMVGFTESLNLSVTAAIILFQLTNRIRQLSIPWQLTESERADLKLQWLKNSLRSGEALEKLFTDNQ